jgi:hypothetical protein
MTITELVLMIVLAGHTYTLSLGQAYLHGPDCDRVAEYITRTHPEAIPFHGKLACGPMTLSPSLHLDANGNPTR